MEDKCPFCGEELVYNEEDYNGQWIVTSINCLSCGWFKHYFDDWKLMSK